MEPVRPDDLADLLDAAYATPEEPGRFDDLVAIAQRFLARLPGQDAPPPGEDVRVSLDVKFGAHAERLARAVEREEAMSALARAETFHARFTINRMDLSVRGNAAAERLTGRAFPCPLDDLPFDSAALGVLKRNALSDTTDASAGRRDKIILATVETPHARSCLALIQQPPDDHATLAVAVSYIDWSRELVTRLGEAFGLSESETDVLEGYLNNLSAKQIAEQRHRSPETIKVQSKAILRKTGCARMPDVLQLSASIAYLLRLHAPATDNETRELWSAPRRDMQLLPLNTGRETAFYVFGEGERTVMFVHGLIQGPFFTERFLTAAVRASIRLVCPSRPGFGFTSAARSRDMYESIVVQDALTVADHMSLDRLVVASTKVGASHACRIATALGDRAAGLAMIAAGVPVFNDRNLAHMDAQTRLASVAARYAPSMMGLMTRLGIATYRRRGVDAFLRNYLAASPRDLTLMDDPEIRAILAHGVYHVVQQGPDAWVRDSASSMAGWEPDHRAVRLPQLWLHGDDDRVMSAEAVADYLAGTPDCTLEVIPDAGMQLIHEHPERVIDRLLAFAKQVLRSPEERIEPPVA